MWAFPQRKTRRPSHPTRRPHLEALEGRDCPSGGLLDPTFGGGTGEVSLALPRSSTAALAIQPQDGKIVSAGRIWNSTKAVNDMSIVRLNPDGSLDTSFNQTGAVDLSVGWYSWANTVAVQPDGKILVGGGAYPTHSAATGSTDYEFAVVRLNSNGTLDRTFASRGVFTWDRTGNGEEVKSLAVLGDGSIVAVGDTNWNPADGIVFKLSSSGALVSSFGSGGAALFHLNSGTHLNSIALAPNGDLIVGGGSYTDTSWNHGVGTLLAVSPSTGRLDTSFNNGQGWVAEAYPGVALTWLYGVALQGNSIIAAGIHDQDIPTGSAIYALVARHSLTGALDSQFGNGGYFTLFGGGWLKGVALERDGSIVFNTGSNGYPIWVGHLSADGQPDLSFGGAGTGIMKVQDGANGNGPGLAIDASGRIVVSGSGAPGFSTDFFARLTPPEAMIGSFTASAYTVTAGGSVTLTASDITANGGAAITQVTFYYLDSGGNQVILGYGTQSSPGVWRLTFTVSLVPGAYTLFAQATDSDGVLGDPYSLTLQVQ
jgi:uncharacterized delta-60 repeat protein